MRLAASLVLSALALGCETSAVIAPDRSPLNTSPGLAKGTNSDFATVSALPALSRSTHGEAYAVNRSGSVIAGYSWDRADRMNPVTWTLRNGSWVITALPYASTATSATARAVNDQGDVAGNDFPGSTPHVVLWPATGGFTVLGCGDLGEGYAISAGGKIVAGRDRASALAALWQPGQCREALPSLVVDGDAVAYAVNGNGTIVGGGAFNGDEWVPVRWRRVNGAWQVEQLDSRSGSVQGANSIGDLVGSVQVLPCPSASGCNRGIIWYAGGGSLELPTLGGETTAPRAINDAGEVVGLSTLAGGQGVPFFWSQSLGVRQLPLSGGGWAFAVSGVRADGTRLVVGAGGSKFAARVWVVRNP